MTEPKIRFLKEDGNYVPKWETTFIGEIVERQEHPVKVDKEVEYREIGIRSHGKGIFHKEPVTGKEFGNKRVFDIVPDCLVLNIVFAWERAVAKTTIDEVGMIASHRFPMYKPKNGILDLDYIVRYLISDKGKKLLELASPGGAGRNRTLGQKAFMESELPLPCYEEQKKMAEFFDKIDDVISNVEKELEAYTRLKAGMLQKMFPRNGSRVPEVRFPGFTEDWEQRKLGNLCERITRKNKNGESDLPLTIASQYGLIDQRDFFNKVVAAKDMSNYYLLKKGEFAYNKSYSNGYDYGSIKRLNAYEQGCLSTLYICFGITSDDIESDYLECFFDTLKWYSDITMICAEGARNHGLLNVDTKAFFDEVTILMPSSKEEQKKISAYLNNLDNLITLHQRELDIWNKMKTGYLQRMFI